MMSIEGQLLHTLVVAALISGRANADVVVHPGDCVDAPHVNDELQPVLTRHGVANDVTVDIQTTASIGDGLDLRLVVTVDDGRPLLQRSYALHRADCPSIPKLLALTLDRHFQRFPRRTWPTKSVLVVAPPATVARARATELAMFGAANSQWLPGGADGEVGIRLGRQYGHHHLGLGLLYRGTLPISLEQGSYSAHGGLLAIVWQIGQPWGVRTELRFGRTRVSGDGFDRDQSGWFTTAEGVLGLVYRLPRISLGLQLAVSPLDQRVATEAMDTVKHLPRVRFGVHATIPIWQDK